jgi:hypothetical protein
MSPQIICLGTDVLLLRPAEWILAVYFVYLALIAGVVAVPGHRRLAVIATAVLVITTGGVLARWPTPSEWAPALWLRDWAPLAYILPSYWLPALLVSAPRVAFERRLAALDSRWFGGAALTLADRLPRVVADLFEGAYLLCSPLLPAGFMVLRFAGVPSAEGDRYWTAVVLAAALSYGALPWLPTRPPRAIEPAPTRRSPVRALNLYVLGRASVQLNTFPSGHVALAVAIALSVAAAGLPIAGAAFGVIALCITVGSVVGRYHYAADAIAGLLVAVVAFAVSRVV